MKECTISNEWKFRDIESVIFENRDLRIVVLSGKGTDMSEITYKTLGLNLLFRNPYGPRSPEKFPPINPHEELFRDYTGGGWSDILPNAGAASLFEGVSFGLHDETPLLKWSSEITERSANKVSASFQVRLVKYPFLVKKTLSLNSQNVLEIKESVTNESNKDLPFSWLIHPTFSRTFASPSSTIDIKGQKVYRVKDAKIEDWYFPSFSEPDGTLRNFLKIPPDDPIVNNTVVLGGLDDGRYSIYNPELRLRFTLSWPKEIFRYVWYYRNFKSPDYPYYGRSSFLALEPCTSMRSGLSAQVHNGDAMLLHAGKSLDATIHAKVEAVSF